MPGRFFELICSVLVIGAKAHAGRGQVSSPLARPLRGGTTQVEEFYVALFLALGSLAIAGIEPGESCKPSRYNAL